MVDYFLKLQRARHHLDDFERRQHEFFESGGYTTVGEYDDSVREYRTRVLVQRSLPDDWPLIVGDCLNNTRAALDCLIFALSRQTLGSDPPESDKVQFPIFRYKEGFDTKGLASIRHLPSAAQGLVRQLQPYHRGNDFQNEPLWRLRLLNNTDKHRRVFLTGALPRAITHRWRDDIVLQPNTLYYHQGGPVKDADVIHRVRFADGTEPDLNPHAIVSFEVAFNEPGPSEGRLVVDEMYQLLYHVENGIISKLEKYL